MGVYGVDVQVKEVSCRKAGAGGWGNGGKMGPDVFGEDRAKGEMAKGRRRCCKEGCMVPSVVDGKCGDESGNGASR